MKNKMKELQEKCMQLKSSLNPTQQNYISLRSLENFIQYFDELKEEHKPKIKEIMKDYFRIIEMDDFLISKETSTAISFSHILKMGKYYKLDVGFRLWTKIEDTLFWGLSVDILLLLFGILKDIYYVPILTLVLLLKWIFLKCFYENQHKVYGGRY